MVKLSIEAVYVQRTRHVTSNIVIIRSFFSITYPATVFPMRMSQSVRVSQGVRVWGESNDDNDPPVVTSSASAPKSKLTKIHLNLKIHQS